MTMVDCHKSTIASQKGSRELIPSSGKHRLRKIVTQAEERHLIKLELRKNLMIKKQENKING